MKRIGLTLVAAVAALAVAGSASGTTNVPAIFTVKVTIKDTSISMTPNHAVRGSTITFILTNRGKKTHTFVIGDPTRGTGKGIGFKQTLRPNQQFTKVMFLDYRGVMPFTTQVGKKVLAKGAFKIR
jgi:hypothetical protein